MALAVVVMPTARLLWVDNSRPRVQAAVLSKLLFQRSQKAPASDQVGLARILLARGRINPVAVTDYDGLIGVPREIIDFRRDARWTPWCP